MLFTAAKVLFLLAVGYALLQYAFRRVAPERPLSPAEILAKRCRRIDEWQHGDSIRPKPIDLESTTSRMITRGSMQDRKDYSEFCVKVHQARYGTFKYKGIDENGQVELLRLAKETSLQSLSRRRFVMDPKEYEFTNLSLLRRDEAKD